MDPTDCVCVRARCVFQEQIAQPPGINSWSSCEIKEMYLLLGRAWSSIFLKEMVFNNIPWYFKVSYTNLYKYVKVKQSR